MGTTTENVSEGPDGGSPQVTIGLIDPISGGPFDTTDKYSSEETSIEQQIKGQNQIAQDSNHYLTLAIITELSRTGDDGSASATVGLADLRSGYLFQKYYNDQPANKVKLRLIIGNIGTRLTADSTVPYIMGRIALLRKQDPTFRGILGLPFSGATRDALNSRKDLSIEQIPMIAPSTSSDEFSNESNFYRIVTPDKTQSCVELDFIINHLIPSLETSSNQQFKMAIFKDKNDPYSNDLASDLEAAKTGNLYCNSYSIPSTTSNLIILPESYTRGQQQQDYQGAINDAIHQNMDIVFFSGYSDDLQTFETSLNQEQSTLAHPKQIVIVGGDGLYTTASTYPTTTYVTIYVPPLASNSSFDLENNFVNQYQTEFHNSDTTQISSETMFRPHALEMFDAIYAFTTALKNLTSLPNQDDFNKALRNIDFTGLTGNVQFNGDQTSDSTRGISDPLNKDIYVMCINKDTTMEAAKYSPGPIPTITSYLNGQGLLGCKPSQ